MATPLKKTGPGMERTHDSIDRTAAVYRKSIRENGGNISHEDARRRVIGVHKQTDHRKG